MTDAFAVGPFAFGAVCEALELDPSATRAHVRTEMQHRGRPLPPAFERAA